MEIKIVGECAIGKNLIGLYVPYKFEEGKYLMHFKPTVKGLRQVDLTYFNGKKVQVTICEITEI